LSPAAIPDLVDAEGWFPSDPFRLGVRYLALPRVRRQLAEEIRAQFAAFAATGLRLDHANAHKHMHLHPTVGRLVVEAGRAHGLRAIRVPAEPLLPASGLLEHALLAWTRLLRRQARRAGMAVNDHCFGLRWSGAMTAERLLSVIDTLPDGISEIYLHPAARRDERLAALMPDYAHEEDLAALLDPRARTALQSRAVETLSGYAALR